MLDTNTDKGSDAKAIQLRAGVLGTLDQAA